jgi:hypothetical protein
LKRDYLLANCKEGGYINKPSTSVIKNNPDDIHKS